MSIEELARREQKLLKRSKRKRVGRAVDRIFGFLLATAVLVTAAALGVGYVFVKGPSPTLAQVFSLTFTETRRFDFIARIFLSEDELGALLDANSQKADSAFYDPRELELPATEVVISETVDDSNPYGDVDEDGDGIILETVSGNGYVGYMIKVLDPKRVFLSRGIGQTLEDQCRANNALGGINGGPFADMNGGGDGRTPEGLTIVNHEVINTGYGVNCFCGIDEKGMLVTGYYPLSVLQEIGIVSGVTWGPILVMGGKPLDLTNIQSGLNPRTAIGQRGDGAILMLVIDGRQVHSFGATYADVQRIMLQYGAVTAFNLDGGSSTTMWYNGSYVNSCSSANGIARPIPDAFLFR